MTKALGRLRPSAAAFAGAAGLLWFLARFHFGALDPTNLGWAMQGDWGQNLIGWLMFRHAPWSLPVGAVPALLHPVGSSIALTDATPLVSLLLKPFSGLLPQAFQFIGPWIALCFVLQGVTGALLTSIFTGDPRLQALGGTLFALSPVLDWRVGHATLCAHWLLLLALWMALRPHEPQERPLRRMGAATALVAFTAGLHPYLWAMVAVIAFALLARLRLERALGWRAVAGFVALILVSSLAVFYAYGLVGHGIAANGDGFDAYTSDLLTLVNPMGMSRLIPALPAGAGQYEGFGYLGLGGLALLVLAAVWDVRAGRARTREDRLRWMPVAVAVGLLGVFALGSVITLAGHRVVSMRSAYRSLSMITGPFRAAGRFIWPLHYLLIAGSLAVVLGRLRGRTWAPVLVVAGAIGLQLADAKRPPIDTRPTNEWNRLRSADWDALAQGRHHLVLFPAQVHAGGGESCPNEHAFPDGLYLSADWLAYRHGMTVNSGYASRVSPATLRACAALLQRGKAGQLDPDTLYVVARNWEAAFAGRPGVQCRRIDGLLACVSGAGGVVSRAAP